MRYHLTAAAILAGALAAALPAAAQSPSADDIIRALRPVGSASGSRGIRQLGAPAAPSVAATASPATPSSGAAQVAAAIARPPAPASAGPSVNLTVGFATGSAELTPRAVQALDELGRALTSSSLAGFRFRIEGHTDTVGTPEANKTLSDRRAVAVVDYLARKWGVDKAKVEAVGMGQEQPLVHTGPNVPQPRNRRVTVINVGA